MQGERGAKKEGREGERGKEGGRDIDRQTDRQICADNQMNRQIWRETDIHITTCARRLINRETGL